MTEIREPNFGVDLPGEWERGESPEPNEYVFRRKEGTDVLTVTLLAVKPMFAIADQHRLLDDYLHHRTEYEKGANPDLDQSESVSVVAEGAFAGTWSSMDMKSGRRIDHFVILADALLVDCRYEADAADADEFAQLVDSVFHSVTVSTAPQEQPPRTMAEAPGGIGANLPVPLAPPATASYTSPDINDYIRSIMARASARHILVATEDEANDLKQQIADGADFAEIARANSLCPSGQKGGDLGEFSPGQMVAEFNDVCFNEEVGVVHGPVKTQFGYHLIEVTSRTE